LADFLELTWIWMHRNTTKSTGHVEQLAAVAAAGALCPAADGIPAFAVSL